MSGGILQAPNWHQDTSWSSGYKPVTDDGAVVSNELADTATVIDTGGTAEGVDLDLLQTHPQFNGSFGTSSTPIRTAADLVQVFGGGPFYFECDAGGASIKTDRVEIAAAAAGVDVQIGSNPTDAGDVVDVYANRGRVLLKGNIEFDAASRVVVGSIENDRDCRLTIDTDADTLAKLIIRAGVVTARNICTDIEQAGGVLIKETTQAVNVELLAGILFYDHQAIAGDNTLIRVHRGATLHLWHNALIKTVSTVILLPGSTIVASEHAKLHTITTKIDQGAKWIRSYSIAREIARAAGV